MIFNEILAVFSLSWCRERDGRRAASRASRGTSTWPRFQCTRDTTGRTRPRVHVRCVRVRREARRGLLCTVLSGPAERHTAQTTLEHVSHTGCPSPPDPLGLAVVTHGMPREGYDVSRHWTVEYAHTGLLRHAERRV